MVLGVLVAKLESSENHCSQNYAFNQFRLNGISHYYQLDQPISVLKVVGWLVFFIFIQILKENYISNKWRH